MSTTALSIVPGSDEQLARYFAEVSQVPLLSAEQEQELARRWHDEGDVKAAHQLVTANLRFVIKIANEYRRYGFRLLDLVQEGNVGLMRAVHKFDPYRGFRLITYAVWWIRAHIHEFILRSWSLVRIGSSRTQRKLFNRLQSAQSRIRAMLSHDDGVSEDELIAAEMEIPVEDVADFRRRLAVPDVSLDEQVHEDGQVALKDRIVDESDDQEVALGEQQAQERLRARLDEVVATLNEREQRIVRARLLAEEPVTLKELGEEFGVSKERARQLEVRVKEKLRAGLADLGATLGEA